MSNETGVPTEGRAEASARIFYWATLAGAAAWVASILLLVW